MNSKELLVAVSLFFVLMAAISIMMGNSLWYTGLVLLIITIMLFFMVLMEINARE